MGIGWPYNFYEGIKFKTHYFDVVWRLGICFINFVTGLDCLKTLSQFNIVSIFGLLPELGTLKLSKARVFENLWTLTLIKSSKPNSTFREPNSLA